MSEAVEGALAGELEEALIGVYERDREMFDADALAAIDALLALWKPDGEAPDPEELSYWAYAAYEALRAVCESYAGRDIPFDVDNVDLFPSGHEEAAPEEILDAEQITAVLGQLRQSIVCWQERGVFRGFYESIRD
jgi:hypothetical protein